MSDQPKPPGPAGDSPDLSALPAAVADRIKRALADADAARTDIARAAEAGDVVAASDAIKRGATAMMEATAAQLDDLAAMIIDNRPVPHEVLDAVATRAALRPPATRVSEPVPDILAPRAGRTVGRCPVTREDLAELLREARAVVTCGCNGAEHGTDCIRARIDATIEEYDRQRGQ